MTTPSLAVLRHSLTRIERALVDSTPGQLALDTLHETLNSIQKFSEPRKPPSRISLFLHALVGKTPSTERTPEELRTFQSHYEKLSGLRTEFLRRKVALASITTKIDALYAETEPLITNPIVADTRTPDAEMDISTFYSQLLNTRTILAATLLSTTKALDVLNNAMDVVNKAIQRISTAQ